MAPQWIPGRQEGGGRFLEGKIQVTCFCKAQLFYYYPRMKNLQLLPTILQLPPCLSYQPRKQQYLFPSLTSSTYHPASAKPPQEGSRTTDYSYRRKKILRKQVESSGKRVSASAFTQNCNCFLFPQSQVPSSVTAASTTMLPDTDSLPPRQLCTTPLV